MASIPQDRLNLGHVCTCGHTERDHEAYEPPYVCGHGMSAETPDGDCDCMDYDRAVALMSEHTVAELRAAREVVRQARGYLAMFYGTPELRQAVASYNLAVRRG